MTKKALIIIDMQKGFLDKKNSWYVNDSEKIVKYILKFCKIFEKDDIYFTKFINRNLRMKKNKNSKFLPDTEETEIIKEFAPYFKKNNIFEKNGYSIFKNNKLENIIENYDELYFCGIEADACVLFSIAEAYDRLKKFKVLKNSVAGFGIFLNKKNFLNYCKNHFGNIIE